MTSEQIETRIAELKKLQADVLANANAIGGAIQDCEFWLERVKSEAESIVEPTKPRLVE